MSDQVFSVEVLVVATAYIRAASAEEAAAIAQEEFAHPVEASVIAGVALGDIATSGLPYTAAGLPRVSLSPAMTFGGPAPQYVGVAKFTPEDVTPCLD